LGVAVPAAAALPIFVLLRCIKLLQVKVVSAAKQRIFPAAANAIQNTLSSLRK